MFHETKWSKVKEPLQSKDGSVSLKYPDFIGEGNTKSRRLSILLKEILKSHNNE
jgi:hypothetical protein